MSDPLSELRAAVEDSVAALRDGEGETRPTLERPPRPELGDYSTNAAMLLAPIRGEQPRVVAEALRDELGGRLEGTAERIEVAGPGFINLFLADRWHREGVEAVLAAGDELGASPDGGGERVNVEFVSANPTGPLTATRSPARWSWRAARSSASTTSTTSAVRCVASRSRSRRGCGARRRPRT